MLCKRQQANMLTKLCFVGKRRLFNVFVSIAVACEYVCLCSDAYNAITYTFMYCTKQTLLEIKLIVMIL